MWPTVKKKKKIFFSFRNASQIMLFICSVVSDVWDGFEFCKEYRNSSEGGTKAMGGLRCDSL